MGVISTLLNINRIELHSNMIIFRMESNWRTALRD